MLVDALLGVTIIVGLAGIVWGWIEFFRRLK